MWGRRRRARAQTILPDNMSLPEDFLRGFCASQYKITPSELSRAISENEFAKDFSRQHTLLANLILHYFLDNSHKPSPSVNLDELTQHVIPVNAELRLDELRNKLGLHLSVEDSEELATLDEPHRLRLTAYLRALTPTTKQADYSIPRGRAFENILSTFLAKEVGVNDANAQNYIIAIFSLVGHPNVPGFAFGDEVNYLFTYFACIELGIAKFPGGFFLDEMPVPSLRVVSGNDTTNVSLEFSSGLWYQNEDGQRQQVAEGISYTISFTTPCLMPVAPASKTEPANSATRQQQLALSKEAGGSSAAPAPETSAQSFITPTVTYQVTDGQLAQEIVLSDSKNKPKFALAHTLKHRLFQVREDEFEPFFSATVQLGTTLPEKPIIWAYIEYLARQISCYKPLVGDLEPATENERFVTFCLLKLVVDYVSKLTLTDKKWASDFTKNVMEQVVPLFAKRFRQLKSLEQQLVQASAPEPALKKQRDSIFGQLICLCQQFSSEHMVEFGLRLAEGPLALITKISDHDQLEHLFPHHSQLAKDLLANTHFCRTGLQSLVTSISSSTTVLPEDRIKYAFFLRIIALWRSMLPSLDDVTVGRKKAKTKELEECTLLEAIVGLYIRNLSSLKLKKTKGQVNKYEYEVLADALEDGIITQVNAFFGNNPCKRIFFIWILQTLAQNRVSEYASEDDKKKLVLFRRVFDLWQTMLPKAIAASAASESQEQEREEQVLLEAVIQLFNPPHVDCTELARARDNPDKYEYEVLADRLNDKIIEPLNKLFQDNPRKRLLFIQVLQDLGSNPVARFVYMRNGFFLQFADTKKAKPSMDMMLAHPSNPGPAMLQADHLEDDFAVIDKTLRLYSTNLGSPTRIRQLTSESFQKCCQALTLTLHDHVIVPLNEKLANIPSTQKIFASVIEIFDFCLSAYLSFNAQNKDGSRVDRITVANYFFSILGNAHKKFRSLFDSSPPLISAQLRPALEPIMVKVEKAITDFSHSTSGYQQDEFADIFGLYNFLISRANQQARLDHSTPREPQQAPPQRPTLTILFDLLPQDGAFSYSEELLRFVLTVPNYEDQPLLRDYLGINDTELKKLLTDRRFAQQVYDEVLSWSLPEQQAFQLRVLRVFTTQPPTEPTQPTSSQPGPAEAQPATIEPPFFDLPTCLRENRPTLPHQFVGESLLVSLPLLADRYGFAGLCFAGQVLLKTTHQSLLALHQDPRVREKFIPIFKLFTRTEQLNFTCTFIDNLQLPQDEIIDGMVVVDTSSSSRPPGLQIAVELLLHIDTTLLPTVLASESIAQKFSTVWQTMNPTERVQLKDRFAGLAKDARGKWKKSSETIQCTLAQEAQFRLVDIMGQIYPYDDSIRTHLCRHLNVRGRKEAAIESSLRALTGDGLGSQKGLVSGGHGVGTLWALPPEDESESHASSAGPAGSTGGDTATSAHPPRPGNAPSDQQ